MKIEIKYSATVTDQSDNVIKNESILMECNGKKDEDCELSQYLNDELLDIGVTSGTVEIGLNENFEVYSKVTYLSPKKLNKAQLKLLVEETNGQMSDGYGEGPYDFSFEGQKYYISLCSSLYYIPMSVEQIPSEIKIKKPRRSPIFTAIAKHDVDKIRKYYKQENFEQVCQREMSPILSAISDELFDIAVEMINVVSIKCLKDRQLLHACATSHSHDYPKLLEVAELLIDKGVDADEVRSFDNQKPGDDPLDGVSALMWAANRGKKPLVELFIKRGADINLQTKGGTTALTFSDPEEIDIVQILLSKGANPLLVDFKGENALDDALYQADSCLKSRFMADREGPWRQKAALIQQYM